MLTARRARAPLLLEPRYGEESSGMASLSFYNSFLCFNASGFLKSWHSIHQTLLTFFNKQLYSAHSSFASGHVHVSLSIHIPQNEKQILHWPPVAGKMRRVQRVLSLNLKIWMGRNWWLGDIHIYGTLEFPLHRHPCLQLITLQIVL